MEYRGEDNDDNVDDVEGSLTDTILVMPSLALPPTPTVMAALATKIHTREDNSFIVSDNLFQDQELAVRGRSEYSNRCGGGWWSDLEIQNEDC